MRPNTTQNEILEAFDTSETKTIADVCRIVDITPSTLYYHANKSGDFRRQIMEKRLQYLTAKIAAEPTSEGENI